MRLIAKNLAKEVFQKISEPAARAGWRGTITNSTLVFVRKNERVVVDLEENVAYFYYNDANYFKMILSAVAKELDMTICEVIAAALQAI